MSIFIFRQEHRELQAFELIHFQNLENAWNIQPVSQMTHWQPTLQIDGIIITD